MNILQEFIPQSIAQALGMTFMHALWQITLVGLLVWILFRLVNKDAFIWKYRIAYSGILLMLVIPIVTFINLFEKGTVQVTVPQLETGGWNHGNIVPVIESSNAWEAIQQFFLMHQFWITAIWLLGVSFFALRFLGGYLYANRLKNRYTEPVSDSENTLFEKLKFRFRISEPVKFFVSSAVTVPLTIGWLKPVVLVPASILSGLQPDQLECILVHELAHIKRHDYLANLIQSTAEILLFFHPVMWLLSNQVKIERENCCDQIVLDSGEDNMTYARALLRVEEIATATPNLAMASNGGEFFQRINRIITGQHDSNKSSKLGSSIITLMILLGGISLTAWKHHTPPPEAELEIALEELSEASAELDALAELLTMDESPAKLRGINLIEPANFTLMQALSSARVNDWKLPGMQIESIEIDSPVTKISIIQNGENLKFFIDEAGQIESIYKNGKKVRDESFVELSQRYRDVLSNLDGNDYEPMPMSEMGLFGEGIGQFSKEIAEKAKEMAELQKKMDRGNEKEMEELVERMEQLGEEMEEIGEKYEDDWEEWGEKFGTQWETWGENEGKKWELWGEKFGEEMESIFDDDFESNLEGLLENQFGEEWEKQWETFGEELQNKLENSLSVLEDIDFEFDEKELSKELKKLDKEREKFHKEMEKMHEEVELAKEDEKGDLKRRIELEKDRGKLDLTGRIARELRRDDLIDRGDGFTLEVKKNSIKVNGKKLEQSKEAKYREIIRDELGSNFSGSFKIDSRK